jgi:hypothetical protein
MNHTKLLCPRISPVTPSTSLNSVNWLVFVERLKFVFLWHKKMAFYTQCGPNVLGLIFLNRRHMWKTHNFVIQNRRHWHIYRLLRWRTVSEKLPKIPLFGPSFTHQLRLLGSQRHPKIGVLLTLFSTWGNRK